MSATAWLVVLVLNGSGNGSNAEYFEQPNMAACEARLLTMRHETPSGGDAEQGFLAFCSQDRSYDDIKWELKEKERRFFKPSTW